MSHHSLRDGTERQTHLVPITPLDTARAARSRNNSPLLSKRAGGAVVTSELLAQRARQPEATAQDRGGPRPTRPPRRASKLSRPALEKACGGEMEALARRARGLTLCVEAPTTCRPTRCDHARLRLCRCHIDLCPRHALRNIRNHVVNSISSPTVSLGVHGHAASAFPSCADRGPLLS